MRPDALVVVSGHHEGEIVEVSTAETPPLLFDYYGFPPHTYELTYPAPGSPGLGRRIGELLADQAMGATIAAYAFGRFGSDPRDDQR